MVKRILIIDDEVYFARLVKMNLESGVGFKVEIALKGYEGIKTAAKFRPHLVLLDLLMPDMNGLQVLEELRKDKKISRTPVIILSAKGDDATRKEVLGNKVDLFVTKPISAEGLRERIVKVLKNSRKSRKRSRRRS
ncbi:MAG: response regulator [Candidatus Omnitrophica bacterium]|nr:response regulator [Candidatus Omnitrophota bacterium]MDD5771354.1 response regulator [Candidatus Omnitrophota bacterium]